MRISDWSSDVCSSDLRSCRPRRGGFASGSWFSLPYSAARETISATRQFLVFDIGAISTTRTTSPSLQLLSASWAWSLLERRMYLPYSACLTWRSTSTVTVLSILLLTTRPSTVRCRLLSAVLSMLFMVMSLLLRAEQRVDACDLAADAAHVVGLGELAGGLLHAQRALLLLQLDHVGLQLVGRLPAEFLEFPHRTVRVPKVGVTGRLAGARRTQ